MVNHKDGRWAREILEAQDERGLWHNFHTLSNPVSGKSITTEQALRRLSRLGFTIDDEPIQRTVRYMRGALAGEKEMPDRREKVINWDVFMELMLATWIRRFTLADPLANAVAERWAEVLRGAYASGAFDENAYRASYDRAFGRPAGGSRYIDPFSFYTVDLPAREMDAFTRRAAFYAILTRPGGIYYIYDGPLARVPDRFASREASRYLGGIELLLAYLDEETGAGLRFVRDWLEENRDLDGRWDMGASVKDGVYFPLSDSWRNREDRVRDCTERVEGIYRELMKY